MKACLRTLLGEHYHQLVRVTHGIIDALLPFFSSSHRFYWLYLLSFLAISYLVLSRRNASWLSLAEFKKLAFPRTIYLHAHAVQTYFFAFWNTVFFQSVTLGGVILSASSVARWVQSNITFIEPSDSEAIPSTLPAVLFVICAVLLRDLTQYGVHVVHHKVPALWELHQVHHYPRRLTPVTAFQFHPVEIAIRGVADALTYGVLSGGFSLYYSKIPVETTVLGLTFSAVATNLFANFRHSHIWLEFPRTVSLVLSSPAMHQTHHSAEDRHLDRNYGIVFSLWDTLFGTLYLPRGKETFELGVKDIPAREYDTVMKLFLTPVSKAMGRLPTKKNK